MKTQENTLASDLQNIAELIQYRFPQLIPSNLNYPIFQAPEFNIVNSLKLSAAGDFNPLSIERLTEEIAALLNRCATARELKLDLEAKALDFWLEVERQEAQEIEKRRQISAGEFSLPKETAAIELNMHKEVTTQFSDAVNHRRDGVATRQATHPNYKERVELTGKVASLSAYTNFGDVRDAARELAKNSLNYELKSAQTELISSEPNKVLHSGMRDIAAAKLAYENENESAKNKLFEIEISSRKKRIELATQPGGGLNFGERLFENQMLFERDFKSAYLRMKVLSHGINDLYGIDYPAPAGASVTLTECLLWTRDITEKLSILWNRELSITKMLSIRNLCTPSEWIDGLHNGTFKFSVSNSAFSKLNCVRIQMARCSLITKALGAWTIIATLPITAEITRPDGHVSSINQSLLPPLWFGNVTYQKAEKKDAECSGRGILNASPIGEWELTVDELSTNKESRNLIEDIIIDLDLITFF